MKAPRKPARIPPPLKDEEAAPEADCLEGFAHPRMTGALFGHGEAEQTLLQAFRSERMHHAWLMSGPEGIGKATLAWRFARFALASGGQEGRAGGRPGDSLDVDLSLPAARQVAALSHPGLLLIRRTWDSSRKRFMTAISVDEVRRLKQFLAFSTAQDAWRVVIVDRADEMNANASNALLKSLEEPPKRTVFLLVASEAGRLLPTIHSRCRRLQLSPLGSEDLGKAVAAALAGADAGEDAAATEAVGDERLALLARGSVRQALVLSAIGGLKMHDEILRHLSDLPHLDIDAIHKLTEKLAPAAAQQSFEAFFALLQGAIARIIRHAATGSGAIGEEAGIAARVLSGGGVARWAELWETLAREKAEADMLNLDRKALLLELFMRLAAAARTRD